MCRWIAYRGETIKLERYVTAPAHSLVVQSLRALEGNASTNGDGFGLGWYDAHDREPGEEGGHRDVERQHDRGRAGAGSDAGESGREHHARDPGTGGQAAVPCASFGQSS